MKKSRLKKINLSFLKKKTPILGFTVMEIFILWGVIAGGTVSIVMARQQKLETVQDTNISQSSLSSRSKPRTVSSTNNVASQQDDNVQGPVDPTNGQASSSDQQTYEDAQLN
jgi:hypothetical protein